MKRKFLIAILAIVSCFACVFGLTACGGNSDSGSTDNGNSSANGSNLEQFNYTVTENGYEITSVKDARIKEAVIPDSVTSIAHDAFRGCMELKSLTIPDSVTYIGYEAFGGCDSIETAIIPAMAITSIPKTNLKSLTVTSREITDAESFSDCNNIISLTIGSDVVYVGRNVLVKFKNLTTIMVDENNKNYCSDGVILYDKKLTEIIFVLYNISGSVTILDGLTSIRGSAFSERNLTSITIPNSVKSIGTFAFCNCSSLTSVTILDGVTSIDKNAFKYCRSLTSIVIPSSVTSIGESAFEDCSGLTSITIHANVTSIGKSAFKGCDNIETATIPVSAILSIPKTNIKTLVVTSGEIIWDETLWDFWDYGEKLTSLTIGEYVTCVDVIALARFYNLSTIAVNENNKNYYSCDGILYNKNLTEIIFGVKNISGIITIPNSVTTIGSYAFVYCSNLTSITIPASVTTIGIGAFDCNSLTTINYGGTKEQWESIDKGDYWDYGAGDYTVYCTDGEIKNSSERG